MRLNVQVGQIGAAVQSDGARSPELGGSSALVEQKSDRGDAGSVPVQGHTDRPLKAFSAVVVEELNELGCRAADGFAAAECLIQ